MTPQAELKALVKKHFNDGVVIDYSEANLRLLKLYDEIRDGLKPAVRLNRVHTVEIGDNLSVGFDHLVKLTALRFTYGINLRTNLEFLNKVHVTVVHAVGAITLKIHVPIEWLERWS